MNNRTTNRLESLDILRGLDLFMIVALEGIMHPLSNAVDKSWFHSFMWNFTHVHWEGFSPWDLIMPLFMFMAGVSMPFALSKYRNSSDKNAVYKRIIKRVLLLWIFGMMCQGNLLGLNPDRIYLYSNTLQSIAFGYLFAAIFFINTKIKTQIIIASSLLLIYWGAMQFISINGYGGGNYTPEANLAEYIDRVVLGRFRDGAYTENGAVVFSSYYRYTWILSSLNFVVTVMTGVFAGYILKNKETLPLKKFYLLFGIGVAMVAVGWLWGLQQPVIKKLWTSSMVLVSSGYCFVLMSLFYYWIDYKGHRKHTTWLKVYGMNSIVAYMLVTVINFSSVSRSLLYGLEQYVGAYYPVVIATSNAVLIYLILYAMYKRGVFLKV
ncbi:putative acyltransferase [Dysgonomonadaceae bacterium PH5-43]|nr:putative acyltransferase [Dysgonomonadaceae bacterium PH5-43]